jgi:hypothetical protein
LIQAENEFQWLRRSRIPRFFALLGARDRVRRKAAARLLSSEEGKEVFCPCDRDGTGALSAQLDVFLREVKNARDRVEFRGATGPQFAGALRTSVFASQLSKLRDVDNALLIEIIHFYADLGTLEQIIEGVNDASAEYTRADAHSGQKDDIRPRLLSSLRVLEEQISS